MILLLTCHSLGAKIELGSATNDTYDKVEAASSQLVALYGGDDDNNDSKGVAMPTNANNDDRASSHKSSNNTRSRSRSPSLPSSLPLSGSEITPKKGGAVRHSINLHPTFDQR